MFENLKSGNIIKRLKKLSKLASEFDKYSYRKDIDNFLPNCKSENISYTYIFFGGDIKVNAYEFKIDKITYGFEDRNSKPLQYIKVNDIVIFHNRDESSCDGMFGGVKSGWNHSYPPEMFRTIKKEILTIDKYIKEIQNYLSGKDKHYQEKLELEKIFCDNKEI